MQTKSSTKPELLEQAGYFTVPGAHLYTVLHPVENPVARVLLVGPFASERHYAYHPLVCWARYLAAKGIEVLRYDYRGIGESTGVFEELSFEHWSEDIELLTGWLLSRPPVVPLVLHGTELGAILAARSFREGIGDAAILWSAPNNANQLLRATLLRWAGLEKLWESTESRRPASEYIRELDTGSSVEVHGYRWSSRLWRESFHFDLPFTVREGSSTLEADSRPVKSVRFREDTTSLVMPYARHPEVKDLGALYSDNFDWMTEVLSLPDRGANAAGN